MRSGLTELNIFAAQQPDNAIIKLAFDSNNDTLFYDVTNRVRTHGGYQQIRRPIELYNLRSVLMAGLPNPLRETYLSFNIDQHVVTEESPKAISHDQINDYITDYFRKVEDVMNDRSIFNRIYRSMSSCCR